MEPHETDLLRRRLLAEIETEDETLVKVVDAVPKHKLDWTPTRHGTRSAADLAWHAAAQAAWFLSCVDGRPTAPPARTATTRADLVSAIRDVQGLFRRRVVEYTTEELARPCQVHGETLPAIDALSLHKMHLAHHRGQLCLYLRLMGVRVPGVYGPSADEERP